jgi:DNA-binding MarR family transcriptional regulator
VSATMNVSTGQLSALLAPLAEAGYVAIAAPAQNSALIAQLTPAGVAAIERLVRARQQGLTQLLGTWSDEHDAQLAGELQQLTIDLLRSPARLDQLLGVPAPPAAVP